MLALEQIVNESEGQDSVAYMAEETFEKLYAKNPTPGFGSKTFITKDRDRILLHYESDNLNSNWRLPNRFFPKWSMITGRSFIEIRINNEVKPGKVIYEKKPIYQEQPANRWPLGMQAHPPTFVRGPILRGVTEVRLLIQMLDVYSGFISGSYAVHCCSPRKHASMTEPEDIDVYLPNQQAFDGFCEDLKRLGFTEFKAKFSHYYRQKLDFVSGNYRDWINDAPAFSQYYAPLYLCPKQINVIQPSTLDLSGLEFYKGSELKERLVARVLSLFDAPACRAAILTDNYAICDENFHANDARKQMIFDSFRSPEMLLDRIRKYRLKKYYVNVETIVKEHPLIKNISTELSDALNKPLDVLKKQPKKADSGAAMP